MKKAIIISCFSWYENRLKPIKEILQKEYEVHCYTADFIHTSKKYIENKNPELEYIHVPSYKKNISIRRFISYICFGFKINQLLKKIKPDLLYLVLPPNNTAHYCLKYKKTHPNSVYYIDLIDLWPESMPINGRIKNCLAFRGWAKLRNESIENANHIFVECNYYRKQLRGLLNEKNSTVLYLTRGITEKERLQVEEKIKNKETNRSTVLLCYLGSINHIIDIDKISKLIEGITGRSFDVELRIVGDGEYRDELIYKAKMAGANVVYYGKIYDQMKKIELLGSCDFGLNIYDANVAVGLTIKSIDYFSMGIPIINTIKGDTWEMISQNNVGINFGDSVNDCVDQIINKEKGLAENAYELYQKTFSHEAFNQVVEIVFGNN